MNPTRPVDPVAESLLVHAAFVQRLARSLAGHAGDDLAQDTLAAALQHGRDGVRNVRAWLATIAANLWRNRARDDARRERRDAAYAAAVAATAAAAAEPAVVAILAREEARRHVVAAVVDLPEPLRAVVLLRFFDCLDSTAIGSRLALPPSTVRAMLTRALERLRTGLDAAHGDRRAAWLAPVAALAHTDAVLVTDAAAGALHAANARAAATRRGAWLLRTGWAMRVALGCVALLLAWLAWPSAAGGAEPPLAPPRGTIGVAAQDPDASPRHGATLPRDPVAAAVAAAGVGPEDLWGRVVAAGDGRAIVGAEVVLEHRDADEMQCLDLAHAARAVALGTARTDGEGAFAFRVRRAVQHRVTVRANGFAPVRRQLATGGSEFVVHLERAAAVEGVVRREDGAPVAGARVVCAARGGIDDGESATTGPDGAFFVGGLGTAPTYVGVDPVGLAAPPSQLVELLPGEVARLEFVVARGRDVIGSVHAAGTGQPVADAAVATSRTFDEVVTSANDGRFVLRGVGDADELHVRAAGFAPRVCRLPAGGTAAEPFVVELERGYAVTGRVIDEHGRPVADAFVAAAAGEPLPPGHHVHWCTGSVAADGRFRVDGLAMHSRLAPREPTLHRWQLLARAPGLGARVLALPVRQLRENDLDVGDVVLAAEALVEGRVVDVRGEPIADALVDLRCDFAGLDALLATAEPRPVAVSQLSSRATRTSGDGVFRFAGVGAGEHQIVVELDGRSWNVTSGPHHVAAGAVVTVPDVVVDIGLVIAGHVRGDARALGPDARLSIYAAPEVGADHGSHYAIVGRSGTFRIERLPAGRYRVFAFDVPPGLAVLAQPGVAAGTEGLELQLVPAATIEGRVVDTTGEGIAGIGVAFVRPGAFALRDVRTGANGRFRIEVAPDESGRVVARHPTNPFVQVARDAAAGARELVLELPR